MLDGVISRKTETSVPVREKSENEDNPSLIIFLLLSIFMRLEHSSISNLQMRNK